MYNYVLGISIPVIHQHQRFYTSKSKFMPRVVGHTVTPAFRWLRPEDGEFLARLGYLNTTKNKFTTISFNHSFLLLLITFNVRKPWA
jgi:hypothetical protein